EVLEVGELARLLVGELLDHVAHCAAAQLPGIDRLQGALAGPRTRGGIDTIRARPPHASCSINCAISSTASTASSPLLPSTPPARASASSSSSTASTPFATGMPASNDTRIRPSAQQSATC